MAFAKPKKILDEAELMEYALKSLASRMRSVRDLRRLMKMRAEPGDAGEAAMDAVIGRLKELNYLNDPRFAADYTRLRKENERHGRRRVQQDLMQKGVGSELVQTTLAAAYDDEDETALVRAYIVRKRMKAPSGVNAQKETARVMGRLARAGFSTGAIFKVLRAWNLPEEVMPIEGGADSDTYAESDGDLPEF
jgi:regulatory protein